MTSHRRIEANRINAQKSTGPKTAEGKEKVRLNALTHGMTAQTAVLPHEDAEAFRERVETWTRELAPRGEVGRYLAERAARISWQLDRADNHERARLAKRVREAPRLAARRKGHAVDVLARRLLEPVVTPSKQARGPLNPFTRLPLKEEAPRVEGEDPLVLLRRIEGSAAGCLRLIQEWDEIGKSLDRADLPFDPSAGLEGLEMVDRDRVLRLLGVRPEEAPAIAPNERRIEAILRLDKLAGDELVERLDVMDDDPEDPDFDDVPLTKSADPSMSAASARLAVRPIVAAQRSRLRAMLARHEADEAPADADLADHASFDDSPEAERLHRYQATWTRALLRTLGMVRKLGDAGDEPGASLEAEEVPEVDAPGLEHGVTPCGQASRATRKGERQNRQIKPIEECSSSCQEATCDRSGEPGNGVMDGPGINPIEQRTKQRAKAGFALVKGTDSGEGDAQGRCEAIR